MTIVLHDIYRSRVVNSGLNASSLECLTNVDDKSGGLKKAAFEYQCQNLSIKEPTKMTKEIPWKKMILYLS
jgi:hypothetical protein